MRHHSICHSLHLWLSIPVGLIAIIICISGAILVFERDLGTIGQSHVEPSGRTPLPLGRIVASASDYVPDNKVVGVTVYPDSTKAYKVMLARPVMGALWVNQYSGTVMGEYRRAAIFRWASAAHRRLFAQSKSEGGNPAFARGIVGVSSILVIVIVVTGIIIWWPATSKQWRTKFAVPLRRGSLAFWHGLHCAGGAVSAVVLLMCALTGLTWSFDWYRDGVYALFGSEPAKVSRRSKAEINPAAMETAYGKVASEVHGREIRIYQSEIDVVCDGVGNRMATDTYRFNPDTGSIEDYKPYESKTRSGHIKGWIYSIHVGSWGGWITKAVYFLLIVVAASLPVSGYYLWVSRVVHSKRHNTNI